MYNVSDAYRAYIDSSTVRKSHAKIIVDGVEYDGYSTLKKYPSISWQAEYIGSFPAKSCTFEAYQTAGLELVGKEIEVFRGLEIDGAIEWVPLGKFTAAADGVKTSNTANTITYTGYDRATRFDVEYTALDLTYPTTIGAFAQELAFRRGVEFDTTPFPCCDIILDAAPNIPAGMTEREIIRQIAELGGANAWISRAGALCISQPRSSTEKISKRKYASLSSKENVFGGINTVVLGRADYDDDIVYQNAEAVAADGVIEWRLEDNLFAEVDRAGFAEYIGNSYIIGMTYTPFEITGCVDDWYLDIGDIIQVQDKNGEYFETVVLSYSTTDRIKSTIAAAVPDDMLTNYEIAGSAAQKMRYVQLQVDHVNNQIQSIAADVGGLQSQITQTAEQIELKVSAGEIISAINQSAETISIDASKINLTGYITASDLSAEGETVIHGGRIDTDSLYVKHLDAADGNFTNLKAASGGTLEIGDWEFLSNGLEYDGGVFDLEYSGGVAKISGTAPMQVGPYANGVTNTLTLYGTSITFGISTSNYQAVMTTQSGYDEICFRPAISNTGNIGTATYIWDSGHFRNLHVHGSLSLDNLTVATLNTSGNARVNDRMVIGSSSASQPSSGLYVAGMIEATSYIKVGATGTADSTDYPLYLGSSTSRLNQGSASSRRYKEDIEYLNIADYDDVFSTCGVVRFHYKDKEYKEGEYHYGLIAEDVYAKWPHAIIYKPIDGGLIVDGIDYAKLTVPLVMECQNLRRRIKALEERMN